MDSSILLPDFAKGEMHSPIANAAFELLGSAPDLAPVWQEIRGPEKEAATDHIDLARDEVAGLGEQWSEPSPASLRQNISVNEHEAAIDDLTRHYEDLLTDEKESRVTEISSLLEDSHSKIVKDVCEHLEQELSAVFAELALNRITQSSVDGLISEIKTIVKRDSIERFALSGPTQLVALVRKALPSLSFQMDVEETETTDLIAVLNGKTLSTGIESWLAKLKGLADHAG